MHTGRKVVYDNYFAANARFGQIKDGQRFKFTGSNSTIDWVTKRGKGYMLGNRFYSFIDNNAPVRKAES